MNATYRLVWSLSLKGWVVASELAKGRRKSGRTVRLAVACSAGLIAFAGSAVAADLPAGGAITAGAGNISQSADALTINQSSNQLNIDWQSFSIGKDHSVTFVQPGRDAVAFNRVTGSEVSSIQGALNANGQVFLSNPNGVLFTPTAQVNVGGILATTLGISADGGGKYSLRGSSDKGITQQGRITAGEGGTVALVAAQVSNTGAIDAHGGSVLMGAGNAVTLDFGGPVKIRVEDGALNALVEQGGAIRADGGVVYLTAKAAGSLGTAAINHTGLTQARSLSTNEKGEIVLLGDMDHGTLNVAGTLDASAPGTADGGFIETSAAHVAIADDVHITTASAGGHSGTWLIDPNDFTIAASGGNMTGAALTSALGSTSVQISTATQGTAGGNGDIFVNDSVSWSANTLTLSAERNIEINSPLYGSGTAGLALEYGLSAPNASHLGGYSVNAPVNLAAAGSFSTKQGSDGSTDSYTIITTLGADGSTTGTDLQGINGNLAGRYVLGNDIDATSTSGWAAGQGFTPIGSLAVAFEGGFDGLGHRITGLTINRPAQDHLGLFGVVANAAISNVGLQGGSVTAHAYAGGLVGSSSLSAFSNVWSSAAVSGGSSIIGGLIGQFNVGTLRRAYSTGNVVSGAFYAGGLIGLNLPNSKLDTVYATGSVHGLEYAGGLLGYNEGIVSNAYSTGDVTVNANRIAGGLVGENNGTITSAYSTGRVTGGPIGGFAGTNTGNISGSYWATDTAGSSAAVGTGSSTGLTGRTLAQLSTAMPAGFSGTAWANAGNQTTPYLLNLAGNRVHTADDGNAANLYTVVQDVNQLQNMRDSLTGRYVLGNDIDASSTANWNAGAGFEPIATNALEFTGVLNGLGFHVSDLTIDRPGTDDVGLIGTTNNARIRNIGMQGGSITGRSGVGSLVGFWQGGVLSNAWSTTKVTGAGTYVGGLTGANSGGTISDVWATGDVSGDVDVGGLTGLNYNTTLSNAWASGSVTGNTNVGGLAGYNYTADITNSYATGDVSGDQKVGGLIGTQFGTVSNSYAQGAVTGNGSVGGLVGWNIGAISQVYSTGTVASSGLAGGLVGDNTGTVDKAFWATDSSGQSASAGGTGTTLAQLMQLSTFASWGTDIDAQAGTGSVWRIYEGYTTPLLRSYLTGLTVTANDASKTYDAVAWSGGNGVSYSVTPNANLLGTLSYYGAAQGSVNAGDYTLSAKGLYSNQQGYDIAFTDGTLSVAKAALSLNAVTQTRTYDGTTGSVTAVQVVGLQGGDGVTGVTQSFDSRNAGGRTLSVDGGYVVNDGNGGNNYTVTTHTASGTIDKAALSFSAVSDSKTYNGTAASSGSVQTNGLVLGDTVTGLTQSFDTRNAGSRTLSVNGGYVVNDGNGGSNYTVTTHTASGTIDKAALAVSAVSDSKTYNGTTASSGSVQTSGLVSGDTITGLTQSFDSRNAGSRTLAVNGGYAVNDGNGGNNYVVTTSTATGTINKAALAISAVSDSKTYDGTTVSSGAVQVSGLISGDTISGAKQSFDSANAGNRTLAVDSGYTVNDGNGGNNYAVTTAAAGGSIVQPDVPPPPPPPPPPPATVEPSPALNAAISESQQKDVEDAKEERADAPAQPVDPLVTVKGTGVRLQ